MYLTRVSVFVAFGVNLRKKNVHVDRCAGVRAWLCAGDHENETAFLHLARHALAPPARAENRGTAVMTKFGRGRIKRYKKRSRCFVVNLDWKMGSGKPVKAYLQPNDIEILEVRHLIPWGSVSRQSHASCARECLSQETSTAFASSSHAQRPKWQSLFENRSRGCFRRRMSKQTRCD